MGLHAISAVNKEHGSVRHVFTTQLNEAHADNAITKTAATHRMHDAQHDNTTAQE